MRPTTVVLALILLGLALVMYCFYRPTFEVEWPFNPMGNFGLTRTAAATGVIGPPCNRYLVPDWSGFEAEPTQLQV